MQPLRVAVHTGRGPATAIPVLVPRGRFRIRLTSEAALFPTIALRAGIFDGRKRADHMASVLFAHPHPPMHVAVEERARNETPIRMVLGESAAGSAACMIDLPEPIEEILAGRLQPFGIQGS